MNLTLNVHESGTLQCGLVQTESPVNFTWHLNGRPLPFNNRLSVSSDLKTKRSTLQLSDVTYAESGNYECIASNSAGSVRQLHVVTVLGELTHRAHVHVHCLPRGVANELRCSANYCAAGFPRNLPTTDLVLMNKTPQASFVALQLIYIESA